jgi:uncharacterized protein YccT (UPF0319 family)
MDYTPGATHIAKWQWDLIHDPGVVLMMFERDKDAMKKNDKAIPFALIVTKKGANINFKSLTIDNIKQQINNNYYLIECFTQQNIDSAITFKNGQYHFEYNPNKFMKSIYYSGTFEFELHAIQIDGKGNIKSLSTDKYSNMEQNGTNTIKFKYLISGATEPFDFEYTIKFTQRIPSVSYNSSTTIGEKQKTGILNRTISVYGSKNFEYIIDSSILLEFIKSIQWNDDKADSTGLNNWFNKAINQNRSENIITITPLFGTPIIYTVNYKPAPALTISSIEPDDGSVGLDNYELYKHMDKQNKFKQYYTEIYTSNGVDYHVPYIIVTANSKKMVFEVKAIDKELIDGKCVYEIIHSENTIQFDKKINLLPDGSYRVECENIPRSGYLIIKDEAGEIKCRIKIVDATQEFTSKSYNYRIVRISYNGKTAVADIGRLHNAFAQLNVVWIDRENIKVTISEDEINAAVQEVKKEYSGITMDKVRQWFIGNSIGKEDIKLYQKILAFIYDKNTDMQSKYYDIIFMPNPIGVNGFANMGGARCFISPDANAFTLSHELGHNLGLAHPGNELGVCIEVEEESDCEINQVKTNNIMGYNGLQRNSFWLWQRLKIEN